MGRSETDAPIFTEGGDDRGGYENRLCRENRRHHFRCQRNARRERKAYAGGACKGSDCKRSNGFAGSRCCLIANTTPKGATPSDPFWEKAEGLFLQAIFNYVWLEEKPSRRNFETVLKLLGEAEVTQQGKPSKLDTRMKFLQENNPLGANHPAVKQYNKCMRGAGDTVRSIIISANSRLAFLENKQVLRLLSKDDLNLSGIGIGVNGDGETKTALFCVIPDSDK